MSEENPPIHQALMNVMAEITHVPKDGYNKQQDFNFRGIDGVLNAVGPAFRKHGILPIPEVTSVDSTSYTTKNGTVMTRSVVRVNYEFRGPAGDCCTARGIPGESADSGDKSVSKAMSVAYRTALIQVLALPTHEADPDADTEEKEAAQATPYYIELGWESEERLKEAHDVYVRLVLDSESDEVKAAMREYRKSKGYGWPMSVMEMDDAARYFETLKPASKGVEDLVAAFPGAELLGEEK